MSKFSFKFALIAFLFISIHLTAQTDSSKTSLEKGRMAVLFSIGSNFRLGPIDGAMFSGKYHLSQRLAVRMGVGLEFSQEEGNVTFNEEITKPAGREQRGYTFNSYLVYYLLKKNIINPYIAAGPLYSYNRNFEEYEYPDRYYSYESIEYGWGAGILFGAEWFFTKNMSLFGEYNPSIQFITFDRLEYRWENYVTSRRYQGETKKITSNYARLGLGVYF
jgi:hypothetical protein